MCSIANAEKARALVARLARDFPREHEPCPIGSDRALDTALITAPEARDPELVRKLDAVAGRVLRIMKVDGKHIRTIWLEADGWSVGVIDQTRAAASTSSTLRLTTLEEAARRDPQHAGARRAADRRHRRLWHGARRCAPTPPMRRSSAPTTMLLATRPTAINLRWALDEMLAALRDRCRREQRVAAAYGARPRSADEDVAINQAIGEHGLELIEAIAATQEAGRAGQHPDPLQRRLARDRRLGHRDGADLLRARRGIAVHVWVDETRPRNQGASLTAWELGQHGVPHTVIADNAGGHLMQHGKVDLGIVGTDRITAHGDVCNKIGTYLKALAAHDNGVPFYVALPSPTIDLTCRRRRREIPIEQRAATRSRT